MQRRTLNSILILAITLLLPILLFGQSKKGQNKKDTTRHWEIGTDLLWLINKNSVPPSLFGEYYFKQQEGKLQRGLRFRLGIKYSNEDSVKTDGLYPSNRTVFNPELRLGFVWIKSISRNFRTLYASEAWINYGYTKTKSTTINNNYLERFRIVKFGPCFSVGFKYYLDPKISISLESSLTFNTRIFDHKGKAFDSVNPDIIYGTAHENTTSFFLELEPIQVINITYSFK